MIDLPEGYEDALHTTVDVYLDWHDRIKVLFGYRLTIIVNIAMEHKPGETITESLVQVWKSTNSKYLFIADTEEDELWCRAKQKEENGQ